MATVKDVVLKHQRKDDGTYNVKIRVTHNRKITYLNTNHYVSDKQLTKDFEIKSPYVLKLITRELADYREKISELGTRIDQFTVHQLADYLIRKDEVRVINFLEFGYHRVEKLKKNGQLSYASAMLSVVNNLKDYCGSDFLDINHISSRFLQQYEAYLRSERKMVRKSQIPGQLVTYIRKGMNDNGIHAHMRDLRVMFNAARDEYNDEDLGILLIKHYPFKKYKIVRPKQVEKKALPIPILRRIRDIEAKPGSRKELARDMFMLSFYLCGMNAKDLFFYQEPIKGRIDYERSKTRGRRTDNAFISVKLIPEAEEIFRKYEFNLKRLYANTRNFSRAITIGLAAIRKELGLKSLIHYHARHSFATIARNKARFVMIGHFLDYLDKEQLEVLKVWIGW